MILDELVFALGIEYNGQDQAVAFQRDLKKLEKAALSFSDKMASIGRNIAIGLGAALTGASVAMASEGMKFEDALTGIQKKLGSSDEAMKQVGKEIMDLATSGALAVPIEEVAAAYERGAAAGLPLDQLKEFATLSAKAADAFEMSAEDVGNAASGFATVLKVPQEGMERLFDLINSLADSGIADESGIVAFMDQAGAMAKTFGMSAEETAALGATLANLKVPAGAAATAMNSILTKLLAPDALSKGGRKALQELVGDFGAFAKTIDEDADGALVGLLKRLKGLDKAKRTGLIADLFGQEHLDTMTQLVEGSEELERNLNMVGRESEWLGSLQRSYNLRLDDASARWQVLTNNLRANLIAVGKEGMPILSRIMDRISEASRRMRENGTAEKIGKAWAKVLNGADVALERMVAHAEFLASKLDALEPHMTKIGVVMGALALRLFPVLSVFALLGLAVDDLLTYLEGGDSVIGDFIQSLATFLGTEPDKVAEVLGTIATAASGFVGAALGLTLFAGAITSLGRALFLLTGAKAAVGLLSRLAGISWGSAAAGAASAAAGAAGSAGAGATAGAAGAGAATTSRGGAIVSAAGAVPKYGPAAIVGALGAGALYYADQIRSAMNDRIEDIKKDPNWAAERTAPIANNGIGESGHYNFNAGMIDPSAYEARVSRPQERDEGSPAPMSATPRQPAAGPAVTPMGDLIRTGFQQAESLSARFNLSTDEIRQKVEGLLSFVSGAAATARVMLDVQQFIAPANQAKLAMADLERGATAKLGLDTSSFDAGLARANAGLDKIQARSLGVGGGMASGGMPPARIAAGNAGR